MDTYFIGVYWGKRQESLDQCSVRMVECLSRLSSQDPLLSNWFQRGRSRKEATCLPIHISKHDIKRFLEKSAEKDIQGNNLEQYGYRMGIWNGKDGPESSGINCRCGFSANTSGLTNCFSLQLPQALISTKQIQRGTNNVIGCLEAIVLSWEPNWGMVISDDHSKIYSSAEDGLTGAPRVSWMLFLGAERGPIPRLPINVQVRSVGLLGHIIILTNVPLSIASEEHMSLVSECSNILERAGLLHPIGTT